MKSIKKSSGQNLFRDLAIIIFSIILAVLLIKTGVLASFLVQVQGFKYFGSFIAGVFFTSIFTVAPATVALGEIAKVDNLFIMAILGGAGAACGDFLIFKFVKNSLADDVGILIKKKAPKRLIHVFKLKFFHWFTIFLGAIIIASPLPDEIGLAMMGFSKVKTSIFLPLSFAVNTIGIMIVGIIARAL